MTSKQYILDQIRKNHSRSFEMPSLDTISPVQYENRLGQFISAVEQVGGKVIIMEQEKGVDELVRSLYPSASVIASALPYVNSTVNPDTVNDASELNGVEVGIVEGKVAVLDCWASWCAPCRRHSIELIPLYEKYKDKGFTVVGVAREYENLDDMKAAIESDGYPWIQLYDLDGAEGVWPLYGLSDAGGGIFLIDRDGKIVRHVREISEVEEYLKENL